MLYPNDISTPLFVTSPTFSKKNEYPVAAGTGTLKIISVVVISYIAKSKVRLLSSKDNSKPNSVDSIFSGLRLGFNLVDGEFNVVRPRYP